MRPLFTNTARKKRLSFAQRSHFPSQVTPHIEGLPTCQKQQQGAHIKPSCSLALGKSKVQFFYTQPTGTRRAAADSQRGPRYDSSSAGKRPEPSVLHFDVQRRVSFRRPPKLLASSHSPATKNAPLLLKPHDQLSSPCGKVFFKAHALMNQTALMRR